MEENTDSNDASAAIAPSSATEPPPKKIVVDTGAYNRSTYIDRSGDELYATRGIVKEIQRYKDNNPIGSHIRSVFKLIERDPVESDIATVKRFAALTGDLPYLSANDIGCIALTLRLQIETGDTSCIRSEPLPLSFTKTEKKSDGGGKGKGKSKKNADTSTTGFDCWITPENVHSYNIKASVEKPNQRVACMTTDFAMQNVLIHMGLNVVTLDGFAAKSVRSWGHMCRACFDMFPNTLRQFCENCGNATVDRVPLVVDGETGEVRVKDTRRWINNRGTIYTQPKPVTGKSKQMYIVAEDQLMMPRYRNQLRIMNRKNPVDEMSHFNVDDGKVGAGFGGPGKQLPALANVKVGLGRDMDEFLPEEEPPNLWDYSEPLVSKATTLENYPDPFINPRECNRPDAHESYVCDPDRILTKVEADRIDEMLSLQRHDSSHHCEGLGAVPYRLGVAIINWLSAEDMSALSDELLLRWRLSHEKCADGVLILYVVRHNSVAISWGKGVEPLLNAKTVSSISAICRSMLQQEKVSVAIERCTTFVTKRLTGVILPSQETPQMLVTLVIASIVAIFYGMIIVSTPYWRQHPPSARWHSSALKAGLVPNDITVVNDQESHFIDESLINDACMLYRSTLGFDDFRVNVLFVDRESMAKCNLQTFGKDSPTDIISLAENSRYIRDEYHLNRSPQQVAEFRHLGEMILCPDYIAEQMRKDLQCTVDPEECKLASEVEGRRAEPLGVAVRMRRMEDMNMRFCYLLAHGFLHLLGYDHVDNFDFEQMLYEEDRLLDAFDRFVASRNKVLPAT
ncbi:20S-pre-rRNA D-site endonuclease nob1 [Babesia sp. Xinjiang]|uniref:20S-pre-rRNA D-site endonuclease nob1 n=1 Tax=Babesia sp. Xinjiang TaxID=462227 RepID=UPI000A246AAE|nr:20S-pre-rRNA D-site endonuclease nob1 [Babesia sp. Xinjiang]ORM39823.1 20S-pre-rRNA D-site endonuclease nob1 [Babesia sp. Xinjiang]